MKASIKNYRQAPRKIRLITDLVKGKSAAQAQAILTHLIKRGSLPVKKLLDSAVSNSGEKAENLIVKKITTEKGVVIKRWMPRAMGRAFPIHKHTSNIVIELASKNSKKDESINLKSNV
ncbi:MAG: ribosomal protein large subunit ribosomal protein [Candidatus Nomurabacteria bacterium]|nr:ribosomal protein large subunit ribosomal protein [Candidatus Nomurabacteria bacterium]